MTKYTYEQFLELFKSYLAEYNEKNPHMNISQVISVENRAESIYKYYFKKNTIPKWMK
jgi:uncharacterized membrane protein